MKTLTYSPPYTKHNKISIGTILLESARTNAVQFPTARTYRPPHFAQNISALSAFNENTVPESEKDPETHAAAPHRGKSATR